MTAHNIIQDTDRHQTFKPETTDQCRPVPAVPEIPDIDLLSEETLDRFLADIFNGSGRPERIYQAGGN